MDYEQAARIMTLHASRVRGGTGIVSTHNHDCKKLKHRTTLRTITFTSETLNAPEEMPEYILRYFSTDIITYCHDRVVIRDGGFFSRSTHDRFNEFLPRGFRVYGTTFPELRLKRPLGFIRTPAGTYPYRSAMAFEYNGKPYGRDRDWHAADHAVRNMTDYVDSYLDKLFAGEPCDVNKARQAEDYWVRGRGDNLEFARVPYNVGTAIRDNLTYKFLLLMVGAHFKEAKQPPTGLAADLDLADLGRLLAYHGAEAFRKPRNDDERARSFERALEYGHVPKINLQKLRAYLRKQLIEYLVSALEFEEVEWHRR